MGRNQSYKDLRVFAEGVRIPANNISRTQSSGKPLSFSVTIPATPVAVAILPGTYIHVFVRRENPQGGIEYSLFAEGRLHKRKVNIGSKQGKVIKLDCYGLDFDWRKVPLGLDIGRKFGIQRPKMMNFFQGLSPREPGDNTLYEYYFADRERSIMLNAQKPESTNQDYVKISRKIKNAMQDKGIVVGMAEVVTSLYQFGPLLNRNYNASKLYKRFGLANNAEITNFITRDFNLDLINQRVNAIQQGASLFDVLNRFLRIALHEFQSIGSPYFNKSRVEEAEKEEQGKEEIEENRPEWMSLTGEERIDKALEDPVVKGALDTIAQYEVGPDYVGKGRFAREQSYSIGYGGRMYDPPTGPGGSSKHPFAEKDRDLAPTRIVYEDGSSSTAFTTDGDKIPEVGDKHNGKKVKDLTPTTAVGRYQFNIGTWENRKEESDKIEGFGPESQDRGAVLLMDKEGALDPLGEGDVGGFLGDEGSGAASRWAGLPTASGNSQFDDEAGGYQKALAAPKEVREALIKNIARYDKEAAESFRKKMTAQRSTIPEAGVMQSLIFKPKTHYEPPPMCNVIFGGEITNASFVDDFDKAPTRTMTVAKPEARSRSTPGSSQSGYRLPVHFAPRHLARIVNFLREGSPFNDFTLSDDLKSNVNQTRENYSEIGNETLFVYDPDIDDPDLLSPEEKRHAKVYRLYNRILEGELGGVQNDLLQMFTYEELFRGVNEEIRRFPFYSRGKKDKEAAAIYGQHQFGLLSRRGRTATVQTELNVDVVPGFPVAVYDESTGWIIGEPYQISDQINASGSSMTNISLYNCVFLADYLNPHYERVYRENESEYAKLDKDGSVQNPIFFDENYNADQIGDTMYEPLFGQESVIDFAKRYADKDKMSLKDALDIVAQAYERQGGQNWLQNRRYRSIATEGQVMQKVLEAYPPEELVQESDEDIPIRDQIYDRYAGVFSARTIPNESSGEKDGKVPAFVEERRSWALMYRKDLYERNHAFAEAEGRTSGTRIQDWEEDREEIVQKWREDLKTYDEVFKHVDPIVDSIKGKTGKTPEEGLFTNDLFRMGLRAPAEEGSES